MYHYSEPADDADKKEFMFRNKKEAQEAFRALLKEKVGLFFLMFFIQSDMNRVSHKSCILVMLNLRWFKIMLWYVINTTQLAFSMQ